MKKTLILSCLAACLLFTVACEKEQQPVIETEVSKESFAKKKAGNKGKVDICHKGQIINVNVNALKGHLKHGDVVLEDADGDGFVTSANDCGLPVDCDDSNFDVNPDATEVAYNGIDDDCNPDTPDDDLDGDGFGIADDCDDTACATTSDCVSCQVFSGLLDNLDPTAVGPFGIGIIRIVENSSFIRFSLQFHTADPSNPAVMAQRRLSVVQFKSAAPQYLYSASGAYWDLDGVFYTPPNFTFIRTNDGAFDDCAQQLLDYAIDNGLRIEDGRTP